MQLINADMELILTGLGMVSEHAQYDADHGGSDEPQVARKIAGEASKLHRALRRFEPGAYIITEEGAQ